jgi:hypothetical protein
MHFHGITFAALQLQLATTAVFGIPLDFLPETVFRVMYQLVIIRVRAI